MFDSFFMGGFECATQRRSDGRRLDLLASTGHARWTRSDYQALRPHGISTVRDGLRWHLIEARAGHYDWSSLDPMVEAARQTGTQVIWDLAHYGWPDWLDIWSSEFVERFAAFAAAAACRILDAGDGAGWLCPVNEVSYWAWAGGHVGHFGPSAIGRADELKRQLARANVAAIRAVRAVRPAARFIQAEPLIHVEPATPDDIASAEAYRRSQYQALDMICGRLDPELGGDESMLDIVGVNFYPQNQWIDGGDPIGIDDPAWRPLADMLEEIHRRYGRPLLIAETGAEGDRRAPWLRYVGDQVEVAQARGVEIVGVCLYPILDYPGWTNDRHCQTGLFGVANSIGRREVDRALAHELARQQGARHGQRLAS